MSVVFALAASLCAAVAAGLFVTMWLGGDTAGTVTLAFGLLALFVLTIMAWREAL